eukprot:270626-Prymnesium_polylepis.1
MQRVGRMRPGHAGDPTHAHARVGAGAPACRVGGPGRAPDAERLAGCGRSSCTKRMHLSYWVALITTAHTIGVGTVTTAP